MDNGLDWTNKGIVRSIEKFNKQSTKISVAMFILALAMFILSVTNIWLIFGSGK
jgi:hypothetical protein